MSWNPDFEANSDEEDEEPVFNGRDAIIFLIDCSTSMFTKFSDQDEYGDPIETSNFTKCLKCVDALMLNRIISAEKDLIGVVFYNVAKSPNVPNDDFEVALVTPANSAIFIGIKPINTDSIRRVKELQISEDFSAYGHASAAQFDDILWLCNNMLNRSGYKLGASTIILFTDNDRPVVPADMQKVIKRAKDLNLRGVDFKLMPMTDSFDGNLFYKEFLCTVMDQSPDLFVMPAMQCSQENMLRRIFCIDYRQKLLVHLNMEIGENIKFGVGLYNFTRKTKIPETYKLMRETNEKIISKRSYKYSIVDNYASDEPSSEEYLTPNLTKKYQTLAGESIYFTSLEMYRMKQIFEPSIKLLGFKPASVLSPNVHIRAPLFCYPDESRVINSTTLFRALWQKCLDKEKVAFAILTQRKRSFPRLVALVPQRAESDADGALERFNGFRIEFIPFVEDIRKLKAFDRAIPETNPEACEVLKKIVKKLKFNYSPRQFENPMIHTIFNKIEEIEFNVQKQMEDCTLPDCATQDEKIAPFVEKLNGILGNLMLQEPPKRKATATTAGNKEKVLKQDIDVLTSIRNNDTKTITTVMLKSYLTELGIKGISKLKKDDMIAKIKDHHGIF